MTMTPASESQAGPATPAVSLYRDGQFLFIDPHGAEALAGLRTERVVAGPSSNGHGYRAEPVGWELFTRLDGRGEPLALACWAGLLGVVRLLLARAGHAVDDRVPAPALLPAPAPPLAEEPGPADGPFLDLVRRRDRALVSYDPAEVSPARLVAQLALAWPGLSVAVAVKRVDEAYRLRKQL